MTIYYISGKITDVDAEKQKANLQLFNDVERDLVARGIRVFNPASLEVEGERWEYYLARDLKWIYENRPVIYLIDHRWIESKGARLEVEFAIVLRLHVIYPEL